MKPKNLANLTTTKNKQIFLGDDPVDDSEENDTLIVVNKTTN